MTICKSIQILSHSLFWIMKSEYFHAFKAYNVCLLKIYLLWMTRKTQTLSGPLYNAFASICIYMYMVQLWCWCNSWNSKVQNCFIFSNYNVITVMLQMSLSEMHLLFNLCFSAVPFNTHNPSILHLHPHTYTCSLKCAIATESGQITVYVQCYGS